MFATVNPPSGGFDVRQSDGLVLCQFDEMLGTRKKAEISFARNRPVQ